MTYQEALNLMDRCVRAGAQSLPGTEVRLLWWASGIPANVEEWLESRSEGSPLPVTPTVFPDLESAANKIGSGKWAHDTDWDKEGYQVLLMPIIDGHAVVIPADRVRQVPDAELLDFLRERVGANA